MDINGQTTAVQFQSPGEVTATATTSAIDVSEYRGRIKLVQQVGTVSGSSPTLDGKVQDSADGSTDWQDVTDATFTQVTASDALESIGVEQRGVRKYIRYVGTVGGSSPTFDLAVLAVGTKQNQ